MIGESVDFDFGAGVPGFACQDDGFGFGLGFGRIIDGHRNRDVALGFCIEFDGQDGVLRLLDLEDFGIVDDKSGDVIVDIGHLDRGGLEVFVMGILRFRQIERDRVFDIAVVHHVVDALEQNFLRHIPVFGREGHAGLVQFAFGLVG